MTRKRENVIITYISTEENSRANEDKQATNQPLMPLAVCVVMEKGEIGPHQT